MKDKEIPYLRLIFRESYQAGLHQKPFDFSKSKMDLFEKQKRDIEAGKLKLKAIGKAQRKAEYKRAQVELLKSYQTYINTLTEE